MGVYTLTYIVYGLIAVALISAISYAVIYSLKQRSNLQAAERNGARPATTTEALLIAQRYKPVDKRK